MARRPENPGTTRHVWIFEKVVMKFPRLSKWWKWAPSLSVLLENLYLSRYEVEHARKYKGKKGIPEILFADPFGFIIVMKRYLPLDSHEEFLMLKDRLLWETDLPLDFWDSDATIFNFGKTEQGELVKIDLG